MLLWVSLVLVRLFGSVCLGCVFGSDLSRSVWVCLSWLFVSVCIRSVWVRYVLIRSVYVAVGLFGLSLSVWVCLSWLCVWVRFV